MIFLPCICFKIFEQFVKTRIKEEYKERKSKLLLAKEEFKKLLEESKVSPRYEGRHMSGVFWVQKCVIFAELTSCIYNNISKTLKYLRERPVINGDPLGTRYFSVRHAV
jgi:hypothetical protein